MAEPLLQARGVTVEEPERGVWVVAPQTIRADDVTIEPDLSNAGPFLAAALLAGGTVTIEGWPDSTTQVGAEFLTLLPRLGATVTSDGDSVTIDGGDGVRGGMALRSADVDLSTAEEVSKLLLTPITRDPMPMVLVDLDGVDYFGSSFLSLLLRCWKAVLMKGGQMVLSGVSPRARELLRITSLDIVWPIYADRSEALAALQSD